MNYITSKKAQALGLITVGMLLAYLLFLVLNNKATLSIVLGFLAGVLFVIFLLFLQKKYMDYTKNDQNLGSHFSSAFQNKVFVFFGIENNKESSDEMKFYMDKTVATIRFLFSSMTMFSVFALCLSIAIYYSSILQLEKISEQNKLICSQNVLAKASNKVALYSIESQRLDFSLKLLRENASVFSQSHRVLNTCREYTKSIKGEFMFSSDSFYDCVDHNISQLEKPLLSYQENEPGAYMTSTPPEDEVNDLRRLYEQLLSIRRDENYKTFNKLLKPFLDYMTALEELTNVTNGQISDLKEQRLQLVSELSVNNSHCETSN